MRELSALCESHPCAYHVRRVLVCYAPVCDTLPATAAPFALYFPFPRVPSMPFLLVMILCCKLISYCLVRGAPIAEDVPHDPIVALHGEEVERAVVGL